MIDALIEHLQKNVKLEDSIDVELFDATLSQIAELNDPRSIGLLIPFFNDKCRLREAMYSIVHAIERFDDRTYVLELLKVLPSFWRRSPYWAMRLHFRILNSPSTKQEYGNALSSADEKIRNTSKQILNAIREREPQLSGKCESVLAAL
jgi:hypothetical protein